MRILLTGATGFLGRAVVARLQRGRHSIAAWVRSPARAHAIFGDAIDVVPIDRGPKALADTMAGADAVVNLAGEPLFGKRWTAARRRVLEESRVQLTRNVARAIADTSAAARPRILVSGSAVGWYGDRGGERLTERSSPGDDYLARVCREWEDAAAAVESSSVRVVLLRTSVVLGPGGGALAQMLPPFRLGLGGPIGSGRQYFPWIHIDDFAAVVEMALSDDRYRGPINVAAPQQVTSREFAAALGRALHRPAILPLPALALRILFGEAAIVILASQRVDPMALREFGFRYAFPEIDAALASIIQR